MRERIADGFDDGFIEFGLLTREQQLNLLAGFTGEVADEPGKAAERVADGEHADPHHTLLDFPGVALQLSDPLKEDGDLAHLKPGTQIAQHGLRDDEFADQVDQLVDLGGIHPDRGGVGSLLRRGALLLLLKGLGNLLWRGGMLFDQDFSDTFLLRQCLVQGLTGHHTGFNENLSQRLGLAAFGAFVVVRFS